MYIKIHKLNDGEENKRIREIMSKATYVLPQRFAKYMVRVYICIFVIHTWQCLLYLKSRYRQKIFEVSVNKDTTFLPMLNGVI